MSDRISVERPFHVKRRAKGQRRMVRGDTPVDKAVPGRIPRVAKLMALAIRFEGLIRDGVVKDQAELARLGRVSRARLTQIMSMLQLAPDIQEAILWLPPVDSGDDGVTERELREVVRELDWGRQRRRWEALGGVTFGEGMSARQPKRQPLHSAGFDTAVKVTDAQTRVASRQLRGAIDARKELSLDYVR